MKGEYLDIVDEVIMKAFNEGVIVIEKKHWEDYAIRHRLLLYGEMKDDYYSLNELGIRYVMRGCSNGLKDKIKRQEEIERLEIQTKSFTRKKQGWLFFFPVSSFVLSMLAFLNEFGVFKIIGKELSETLKLICSS